VDSLAAHFGVTPQTIRKDLNQLCEQGLLQRYHGGAMPPSGVANLAYEARRQPATEAMRRIGLRAAQLIPKDCSLLINMSHLRGQCVVLDIATEESSEGPAEA
jgi:DeoR family glycerol-3-phosphate regulon repressor